MLYLALDKGARPACTCVKAVANMTILPRFARILLSCARFSWDVTHSYGIWLTHMWRDSLRYAVTHWHVTWRIDMWRDLVICDVTHWYVTWLIDIRRDSLTRDVTHWYVTWLSDMWRDSLICDVTHWYVTWRIDMWRNRGDSFTCDLWLCIPRFFALKTEVLRVLRAKNREYSRIQIHVEPSQLYHKISCETHRHVFHSWTSAHLRFGP